MAHKVMEQPIPLPGRLFPLICTTRCPPGRDNEGDSNFECDRER